MAPDGAPAGDRTASKELTETLREAQRLGFFGPAPISGAIEHAWAYVTALGDLPRGTRLIDLGSGGGLPGLVLAEAFPQIEITLIDRRQKRTDFLRRAARRLGFGHVDVRWGDVADLARAITAGTAASFDVVTARGFGPPHATLILARRMLSVDAVDARIIISEPPGEDRGDRWDAELMSTLGLTTERVGPVRRFTTG